ncbi:MAG: RNA polymerase sigma factor, partial [Lentisphaeraceae bacterium]|nr:RNA polymerase sigma factor [Lentisphaeraceae bacterium]
MDQDKYKTRQTLLERLSNKYDENSWNEFIGTYKAYICVVIMRMGINESDTEDLAQQVMLKLWKKLPGFNYNRNKRFRNYLASTARNTVNDFIRKINAEKARLEKADINTDEEEYVSLPDINTLINEEWESFIANLALDNIRSHFEAASIDIFLQILDGRDPQELADNLGL